MKKRIMAIVMALLMALTVIPVTGYAAEETPVQNLVVNADWATKNSGETVYVGSGESAKSYIIGTTAFSLLDAAFSVATPETNVTVIGGGNVGESAITTAGTYNISNDNWAKLGSIGVNSSLISDKFNVNIKDSKLVMKGLNLLASPLAAELNVEVNIENSNVDFADDGTGAANTNLNGKTKLKIKDSVVGYAAEQGNSAAVVAGGTSGLTDGNFSPSVSGTLEVEGSTVYTSKTIPITTTGTGSISFKDSVVYGNYFSIQGKSASEVSRVVFDNSKFYKNSSNCQGSSIEASGELVIKNGSEINIASLGFETGSTLEIDATSTITADAVVATSGTIKVDMTGATAPVVKLISATTGFYGTYCFADGKDNNYKLVVVDNCLYAVTTNVPVVKVNGDWAGKTMCDEIETGYYYGVNAFSDTDEALAAAKFTETVRVIAYDNGSALAAFNMVLADSVTKNVTLETVGSAYIQFAGLTVGEGQTLTLADNAWVSVAGVGVVNNGTVKIPATASIKAAEWEGASGDIEVDMTSATDDEIVVIKAVYKQANEYNYGSYAITDGKDYYYELTNSDKSLVAKRDITSVYIASSKDLLQVVDVEAGSTDDAANVQLYKANETGAQKWTVITRLNGYSIIMNEQSGKVLDVTGATAKAGTNVQQYELNWTDAQLWSVEEQADGTVIFRSKLDGNLVLDAAGGASSNGTNLQIYTDNGTAAQRFYVYNRTSKVESDGLVLADGYYALQSAVNGSYYAEYNNGNIELGTGSYPNDDNQIFYIEATGDELYTISQLGKNAVLSVDDACVLPGSNVEFETGEQTWKLIPNADGTYTFQSVETGLVLDVAGGLAAEGQNIQGYVSNGTAAQKWSLVAILPFQMRMEYLVSEYADVLEEGEIYTIASASNNGFAIDVEGASAEDGADIQLYTDNETTAQQWMISKDQDGYVTFVNVGSGKVLDAYGAIAAAGTKVWQYEFNASKAQKWIVVPVEGGNGYRIVSAMTDKFQLGLDGTEVADGTNLCLVSANASAKNMFTFSYDLAFNTNEGKWNENYTVANRYYIGKVTALPTSEDISKENYVFEGWYTDEKLTEGPVSEIAVTETGDKEFYAKWTVETSYKTNAMAEIYKAQLSVNATLAGCHNVTKTGIDEYKNSAVNIVSKAVADIEAANDTAAIDKLKTDAVKELGDVDTNVKSAESTSCWTLKFSMNGNGTQIQPVTAYKWGSLLSKPADPVQVDWTFGGWYKDAACTIPWNFETDTISADYSCCDQVNCVCTLYAKWSWAH